MVAPRRAIVNPRADAGLLAYGRPMTDRDQANTQGVPDENAEADTASGGAPEKPDTTDENGRPVDNPSGG